MENKLAVHTKSYAAKSGRRFLALLLSCILIFSLSACGGQKTTGKAEEIKPVAVEREPEPQALQTANRATAIALRQYVYARLLTEAFLTADASAMTAEGLSKMADKLLLAWENAELSSSTAMELTNQAVLLLEMPTVKQTSSVGHPCPDGCSCLPDGRAGKSSRYHGGSPTQSGQRRKRNATGSGCQHEYFRQIHRC